MNFLNRIDQDITLLLDNLPVGIIRFNSERQCVYANKFIINLFGLENSTKTDMFFIYINSLHNEDKSQEMEISNKFLLDYEERETTIRIYNKQKREYRWMTNKRTFIQSDNSFSYMYTLQDIHENKLLELQLRNETLKAEKAYNHKSAFLANMSHEIRTPLNGIIGMLTLLEDSKLSNDQYDYISMIKECSFNLMTIINDILDYSKLEVGKITLDIKPMNLRECIESTNDIILSKVYEKSLEYTFNIDPEISPMIYGDQNRIKQILLNLLSNSIKFTDKGNIYINVKNLSVSEYLSLLSVHCKKNDININETTMKKYLRFDVVDTGCGIDPSDKKKLFKSFSQVDTQLTSKIYQGTGLGLAICKELVELMNGCVWLDWSEISKGSKFSFVLPITECLEEECKNEVCENVLKDARVLIVDDNLHNRISLSGMIAKWGMKSHCFSNAEEALHFTRICQFDLGLIDICMPKTDGLSFAQKLRSQKEFNNETFPLVALSSLGDKIATTSKYFKTHLIKPIKEAKLKKICIDLLQKRIMTNSNQSNQSSSQNVEKTMNLDNYIYQNNLSELKDNVRILLAEDVYINQKVVISFLNKIGFSNVQVVENGQQCLDLVMNNQFDIVLLDIRMPILNGEVVLQEILKFYDTQPQRSRPYIIAVTAYCLREDRDKYLKMGFDDYIPKPITIDDLTRCLNTFIESLLHN